MSTYIKRDKILATLQYAAMFSAQHPSSVLKKLQQTIATARKVFRLGRPVEELLTYATSSQGDATIAPLFNIIGRCSPFFNAIYFACDHVVLAKQIGLVSDGDTAARAQNYSLLAWLAASLCSAVHAYAAVKALTARRSGEDSEQRKTRLKNQDRIALAKKKTLFVMFVLQAILALALLRGSGGKFTGLVGTAASDIQ